MDQRKKAALMLIGFAFVIACLAGASYWKTHRKTGEEEKTENVYSEVPDGDVQEMSESKSDAYLVNRDSNIEDYWNDLGDEYAMEDREEPAMDTSSANISSGGPAMTTEQLFGNSSSPAPQKKASGGSGYRETPEQREARHQKRREEAIELADRMQRGQDITEEVMQTPAEEPRSIIIPADEVRRSDAISSLDDSWTDGGVSSLDAGGDTSSVDDFHPFKCMFVREEKIKSGQRVSVRLLEDIVVGGVLIPRNTHIMASCSIGSRLDLEISSIEMQGRILTMGYEAYDTDGMKGIYCPDSGGEGKTVRNRGAGLAGTALSSRVGRLASDVVSTGVSLIQNASGERTVSVPSGYTFYIVKKKK